MKTRVTPRPQPSSRDGSKADKHTASLATSSVSDFFPEQVPQWRDACWHKRPTFCLLTTDCLLLDRACV